jgi:seryl-tRNA(Sec) selenium transferase
MEYRVIKAEDVSLNLMEKELSQKRLDAYDKRVSKAIDEKGNKLDETTNAENNLLDKQIQADQNKIENLKLEDQVNYSTLKIFIYQREKIHREMTVNYKNISSYKPNVFIRILDAFLDSLQIFEEILLFIVRIWFVFVIAIVGYILYRKYLK